MWLYCFISLGLFDSANFSYFIFPVRLLKNWKLLTTDRIKSQATMMDEVKRIFQDNVAPWFGTRVWKQESTTDSNCFIIARIFTQAIKNILISKQNYFTYYRDSKWEIFFLSIHRQQKLTVIKLNWYFHTDFNTRNCFRVNL